jgi:hypothetical protein
MPDIIVAFRNGGHYGMTMCQEYNSATLLIAPERVGGQCPYWLEAREYRPLKSRLRRTKKDLPRLGSDEQRVGSGNRNRHTLKRRS